MITSGRCAELRDYALDAGPARRALDAARRLAALPEVTALGPLSPNDPDVAHGVAVLRWRFAHSRADLDTQCALAQAQSIVALLPAISAFLVVEVVAARALQNPVPLDGGGVPDADAALEVWDAFVRREGVQWSVAEPLRAGGPRGVLDVLRAWRQDYVTDPCVHRWDSHPAVAQILVRGQWEAEVRAIQRNLRHSVLRASSLLASWRAVSFFRPSRRELARLQREAATLEPAIAPAPPAPAERHVVVEVQPRQREYRRAGPRGNPLFHYDARFLVDCVLFGSYLRDARQNRAAAMEALGVCFPQDAQRLRAALQQASFTMPGRTRLLTAAIVFDCACMLFRRLSKVPRGVQGCERYLTREVLIDASPKFGRELFAIRQNTLWWSAAGELVSAETRLLAVPTLAPKHMGAAEKAMALLQAASLEHGRDARDLLGWCRSVVFMPTDLGVEFSIAEGASVIGVFFGVESDPSWPAFLFPRAARFPGINHLVDNIARECASDAFGWLGDFVAQLRCLTAFFHERSYTDALCRRLREKQFHGLACVLEQRAEKFVEWRWGSLVSAVRGARQRALALQIGWDASDFSAESKLAREAAVLAGESAAARTFWRRALAVDLVLTRVEEFRRWATGCECHARERAAGEPVDCKFAGRRCGFLYDHLQAWLAEYAEHLAAIPANFPEIADSLLEDVLAAGHLAMGRLAQRLAFLEGLPWRLFRRPLSRELAGSCVEMFDAAAERDPAELHRVAIELLSPGSPCRRGLEAYVSGADLPDEVVRALAPYTYGKVDEAAVEGVHAGAARAYRRAPGTRHASLVASLRFSANRALYNGIRDNPAALRDFFRAWRQWKLLGAPPLADGRRNPWRVPQEVRAQSFREVVGAVYHFGEVSFRDWSGVRGHFSAAGAHPRPRLGDAPNLALDYIHRVVRPGQLYSLPVVLDADALTAGDVLAADPWARRDTVAADRLADLERRFPHRLFFRLLDLKPADRRGLRDPESAALPPWAVFLEEVTVWGPANAAVVHVGTTGAEQRRARDALGMAPWPVWRDGLRRWTPAGPSDVVFCEAFRPAADLVDPCASRDMRQWPCACLLERLGSHGWMAGRLPGAPHLNEGDRLVYVPPGHSRRREYYMCLLQLGSLFRRGLGQLACDEVGSYYKAILAAERPALILPGLGDRAYRAALRGDAPDHAQLAAAGDGPRRRRPRIFAPALADAEAAAPAAPGALVDDEEGGGDEDFDFSFALEAAFAGALLPAVADEVDQASAALPAEPELAAALGGPRLPELIEGCRLSRETRPRSARGGGYDRLRIICPFHDNCTKKRNLGLNPELGPLAPVGFLGCWVAAGADIPGRASARTHIGRAPTFRQTQSYMERNHL